MIEINNMKSDKPFMWRLTAMPTGKEYGATLQIVGPTDRDAKKVDEKYLKWLIIQGLEEIVLELE